MIPLSTLPILCYSTHFYSSQSPYSFPCSWSMHPFSTFHPFPGPSVTLWVPFSRFLNFTHTHVWMNTHIHYRPGYVGEHFYLSYFDHLNIILFSSILISFFFTQNSLHKFLLSLSSTVLGLQTCASTRLLHTCWVSRLRSLWFAQQTLYWMSYVCRTLYP